MAAHLLYYLDRRTEIRKGHSLTIGRAAENDIVLPHGSVSRFHAVIEWSEDLPALSDLGSTNGTSVNFETVLNRSLRDGDRITVGPFVMVYRIMDLADPEKAEHDRLMGETLMVESQLWSVLDEIRDQDLKDRIINLKHMFNRSKEKLHDLANHDLLTGLYNRRHFDHLLSGEIARATRYGHPLALIMIDIDRFKNVNDTHGHQKGDQVLRVVAALVRENTRTNDMVARYGGEEMTIILPQADRTRAAAVAEKIRAIVEAQTPAQAGLEVTVSLGVAALGEKQTAADLIARADSALYQAKRSGRNRYVISE
jgi:diguanylate cyclase (GGDEF)-like protein